MLVSSAERFRKAVAHLTIPNLMASQHADITVSIGVNTHGAGQNYLNVSSFLQSADQLLYQAKAEGRNQVRFLS